MKLTGFAFSNYFSILKAAFFFLWFLYTSTPGCLSPPAVLESVKQACLCSFLSTSATIFLCSHANASILQRNMWSWCCRQTVTFSWLFLWNSNLSTFYFLSVKRWPAVKIGLLKKRFTGRNGNLLINIHRCTPSPTSHSPICQPVLRHRTRTMTIQETLVCYAKANQQGADHWLVKSRWWWTNCSFCPSLMFTQTPRVCGGRGGVMWVWNQDFPSFSLCNNEG